MQPLKHSARLKMNRDTFFVISPNKGVYFRNNFTSLRMEGSDIGPWIERLIPVFDGTNALGDLSNGLPEAHLNRLYEIAQALYENGFAQDVSHHLPHQLPNVILTKYANQIEYLESLRDSGGHRFQSYRQTKVIAIGSGSLLVSLVQSLIQSGLPAFSVMITDVLQTDQQRIKDLMAEAKKLDPELDEPNINLIEPPVNKYDKRSWRAILKPFDSILYGSKEENFEFLRFLQTVCKEEEKTLLPVTVLKEIAFVGPVVDSESQGCWESAYRRVQNRIDEGNHLPDSFSSTAAALLANLLSFHLFKKRTGLLDIKKANPIYLLNLNTLEGHWHSFIPHPLVTGQGYVEPVNDPRLLLEKTKSNQVNLFSLFNKLTSKETGIFHFWEEQDLIQLPLSQCKIQVTDPLSEGPAQLFPELICSGLTHEEARREAGLVGIETYMRAFLNSSLLKEHQLSKSELWGFGTGENAAEGLNRALQNWLDQEFENQVRNKEIHVRKLEGIQIKDEQCHFYLQSLITMGTTPDIYSGREIIGFPSIWVHSNGLWYGSAGLDLTDALRRSLMIAITNGQNKQILQTSYGVRVPSVNVEGTVSRNISFAPYETLNHKKFLSSLQQLQRSKKQVNIFQLHLEDIFKNGLAGLYGLVVREEEFQ